MKETKDLIEFDLARVISRAKKEFGTIKMGYEMEYDLYLNQFERSMYEFHIKYNITDFELKDIISMTIYDIKSIVEDKIYNYEDLKEQRLIKYCKELQKLFNPFINKDIIINDMSDLKGLFTLPVMCLLRIYDSIDIWHEKNGVNGYFKMIERLVLPVLEQTKYCYVIDDKYLN